MHFSEAKPMMAKITRTGAALIALAGCTSETHVLDGADFSRGYWAVVYRDAAGNAAILDRAQLLERYRDRIRVRYNQLSMIADAYPAHATLLVIDGDRTFYETPPGVPDVLLGDARPAFVPARMCSTTISQAGRARVVAARTHRTIVSEAVPSPKYADHFSFTLPAQVFRYARTQNGPTQQSSQADAEAQAKIAAIEARIRAQFVSRASGDPIAMDFSPGTTFVAGNVVDAHGELVHDRSGSIVSDDADFIVDMTVDVETSSRRAYERIRAIPRETLLLPSRIRSRRPFLVTQERVHPHDPKPFAFDAPPTSNGSVGNLEPLTLPFAYYIKGSGRCPFS
jgi:hypothetical protein